MADDERRAGWQCVWTHARSGDVFTGDVWPDRPTAEWMATMLRDSPWCLNVRICRYG